MFDRIDQVCPGKYVEGVKCVSLSEDVFNEHFPGHPVFPGSLILEGLAQLSGVFFEYCMQNEGIPGKVAALSMINRMKYRRIVTPGDCLVYRAETKVFYPNEYGVAAVRATCQGKLCAEGELMFAFLDIMDDELRQASDRLLRQAFRNVPIIPAS